MRKTQYFTFLFLFSFFLENMDYILGKDSVFFFSRALGFSDLFLSVFYASVMTHNANSDDSLIVFYCIVTRNILISVIGPLVIFFP